MGCIPWCVRYADGGGLTVAGRLRRESVRVQAAELFEQAVKPPEVARRLRVSPKSAYQWHQLWREVGIEALASRGPSGSRCRLSPRCLEKLAVYLEQGPAAQVGARPGARLIRYPGATLTAALVNLRPGHPEFATPGIRTGLLAAIDRDGLAKEVFAGLAVPATGPIPPSSPMFDPKADPAVPYSRGTAEKAFSAADWKKVSKAWRLPNAKEPLAIEVLSPTESSNPLLYRVAEDVVADWTRVGIGATHVAVPPSEFASQRLAAGRFQVAIADLRIGLDPDLYPLLASSQTLTGGSNVMGVQSAGLDALLEKARAPGSASARRAAYSALQTALAAGRYVLPLAFADEVVVVRDTVQGPSVRQVTDGSDRFWDVLTWRLAVDR